LGLLDPLYNPQTKYLLDLIFALLATGVTYLANEDGDLEGWEYLYKSDISGGTINWTLFAFYLTLYFPQYWGDLKRLELISLVLVIFWLIVNRMLGSDDSWK
jgi:hypothetical protein